MNQPQPKSSFSGAGLGVTAVLAMVLCCAAPALVAGGLLASLGAVIGSPAVIALGVAVVGGAVVFAVRRRRRSDACCLSPDGPLRPPSVTTQAGHPCASLTPSTTDPRRKAP